MKRTSSRAPAEKANAARLRKPAVPAEVRKASLADSVYLGIKQNIFDFQLLPGDRFTENEIATRLKVSRTPVREALYRLEREGYLQVQFRSG